MPSKTYYEYIEAVREYLKDEGAINNQHTRSNQQIADATEGAQALSESARKNYLSYAAKRDNSSGIISEGPRRGYWLDEAAFEAAKIIEASEASEASEAAALRPTRVKREAALYPPVTAWLRSEGYRARNVADLRGGSKWSNPDVVGLLISKHFGLTDIEIASVEVKTSKANWKQDIFEAIAHKRFANRVYYCYPVTEGLDKLDEDIRRYSELYRVGILQMFLDEDELKSLQVSTSSDELPNLSSAEIIVEKIPAPYDFVAPRYQIEFLKNMNLNDEAGLWRFGADEDNYSAGETI